GNRPVPSNSAECGCLPDGGQLRLSRRDFAAASPVRPYPRCTTHHRRICGAVPTDADANARRVQHRSVFVLDLWAGGAARPESVHLAAEHPGRQPLVGLDLPRLAVAADAVRPAVDLDQYVACHWDCLTAGRRSATCAHTHDERRAHYKPGVGGVASYPNT